MGIPGFFAWLQRKYPAIVKDIEVRAVNFADGIDLSPGASPVDESSGGGAAQSASKSSFQCENLFLDTNGIIHAGTHPPGGRRPKNEAEMFQTMQDVLDRLVSLAQPTNLLYIAIDGVAPRAKINQQRARRFVAAKMRDDTQHALVEALDELRKQNVRTALHADAEEATAGEFDHNAISPGTAFMERMIAAVKDFVAKRLRQAAEHRAAGTPMPRALVGWRSADLKVVFSDCSVPREGEHKILDFIRRQKKAEDNAAIAAAELANPASQDAPRATPSAQQPKCKFCIYGEDADLIMLALALHDPRVRVMRQLQVYRRHELVVPESIEATPYAVVDIEMLRKYVKGDLFRPLEEHLYEVNAAIALAGGEDAALLKFDLERAIDDFVLLGFMIGNDFLPPLPALDIRRGALELLLEIHKEVFAQAGYVQRRCVVWQSWFELNRFLTRACVRCFGGRWLTDGAKLNFEGLKIFMQRFASVETALLQQNQKLRAKVRTKRMALCCLLQACFFTVTVCSLGP